MAEFVAEMFCACCCYCVAHCGCDATCGPRPRPADDHDDCIACPLVRVVGDDRPERTLECGACGATVAITTFDGPALVVCHMDQPRPYHAVEYFAGDGRGTD